ncbi:HAMP domain-containing sensor histidine kinase [uncultured Desulfosarcina sp.]|uniref:sensor histidine kinase n=1 Tax=uncultured Desulfosarcina sp. TaxID=218289 RepID=UPI0029C6B37C|nr:HAMP domain-containing sensor histidine kinase [uncultured Desulfosarcina sp.]
MKAPRPLRTRIVFYFCGYLAVLLTLYSGALVSIFRGAEDLSFNRQLEEIAGRLARHVEDHGELPDYLPMHVSAYIGLAKVPPPLQDFVERRGPGVFEINKDDLGYHAALVVLQPSGKMLYAFYDVSSIKATDRFESNMAIALIAIGLAVLVMGWLLARSLSDRILNPITDLAEEVQALSLEEDTRALRSTPAADEVGTLVRTINQLLERIAAFSRREREFTAHASHELRTPATVIKGAVEILEERIAKEDTRLGRPLGRINRAVTDLDRLIDTFLILARQEKHPDKEENCDLQAMAKQVVAAYEDLLEAKPVTASVRVLEAGWITAPASLLTIALGNLVRNAFQYTMKGQVEVIVRADRVCVIDNGPGVDFSSKGRGLGLTIVRRICETMDWRFTIAGEPAGGTRAELIFSGEQGEGQTNPIQPEYSKHKP